LGRFLGDEVMVVLTTTFVTVSVELLSTLSGTRNRTPFSMSLLLKRCRVSDDTI
jgi:hypothetical protein